MNSQRRAQRGIAQLPLLAVLFVLMGIMALLLVDRQHLADWWQLRGYDPPAAIANLAAQDTMTDYARKIFYVNHPAIETKDTFNKSCPESKAEQTIVLGCYHSDQRGIFVYDVTDPRLEGVEQVTAAHEMLHAAYDRLGSKERRRIDGLLEAYYNNGLQDDRIKKTIDAYRQTEPNDVVNEMHSIFGTEVANLPPELETYYKQYFADRTAVTNAAARYQAEFTSRQTAVAQADAQLATWKTQIDSLESDIKSKQQTIEDQQNRLNSLRTSSDVSAYNAAVPGYNNLVDAYNAEVQELKSLIAQYNALVASRNALVFEENQLIKSLDSSSATEINQ